MIYLTRKNKFCTFLHQSTEYLKLHTKCNKKQQGPKWRATIRNVEADIMTGVWKITIRRYTGPDVKTKNEIELRDI